MKRIRKPKFDPNLDYVAHKRLTVHGKVIEVGEPFDLSTVPARRARQLYEWSKIELAPEPTEEETPIVSDFVEDDNPEVVVDEVFEEELETPEEVVIDDTENDSVEDETPTLSDEPTEEDVVEETSETVSDDKDG